MRFLSQRDPLWSEMKLGMSNVTCGRFGCTITSASMMTSEWGSWIKPDEIATQDVFTSDGYLYWAKFGAYLRERKVGDFEDRLRGEQVTAIEQSMRDKNRGVILEVNSGAHWVYPLRRTVIGNDWVCADPWTGEECLAKRDYRNVSGSAHFTRFMDVQPDPELYPVDTRYGKPYNAYAEALWSSTEGVRFFLRYRRLPTVRERKGAVYGLWSSADIVFDTRWFRQVKP